MHDVEQYLLPDLCCSAKDGPQNAKLQLERTKIGNIDVIRIGEGQMSGTQIALPDDARYFSADHNLMMMWTRGYEAASYIKSGMLAGKLALLDFTVAKGGHTSVDVKIDSLISNPPADEAIFSVPETAQALSQGPYDLKAGIIKARCISCPQPRYPEEARHQRIQGTVVLLATIDQEGTVRDLRVVSSPDVRLTEAAMESVRSWRYSPTLIEGDPHEVISTISVNFRMN
jgi:TonB family protein